jgi:hypothetical protein
MTDGISHLRYDLQDGYVHNWLVLGPYAPSLMAQGAVVAGAADAVAGAADVVAGAADTVAGAADTVAGAADAVAGAAALSPDPDSGAEIAATAVEPAETHADVVEIDAFSGQWRYTVCLEDHLVTVADVAHPKAVASSRPTRIWAYAELEMAVAGAADAVAGAADAVAGAADAVAGAAEQDHVMTLSARGNVDVWVNGVHIHRLDAMAERRLRRMSFVVALQPGRNSVLVCSTVGADELAQHSFALQVAGAQPVNPVELQVIVPTRIARPARRRWLEAVFEAARLSQYVFTRQERPAFLWPVDAFPGAAEGADAEDVALTEIDLPEEPGMPASGATKAGTTMAGATSMSIRVQTPERRIYSEANPDVKAGAQAEMSWTYQYPDGPLDAILMPRPREYYEGNMRITRTVRFWSLDNNKYTATPTDDYQKRRNRTLLRAAQREANLYSEIAKMAIGLWPKLDVDLIYAAIEAMPENHSLVYRDGVGLLGMLLRYGEAPEFPEEVSDRLRATLPTIVFFETLPASVRRAASEGSALLSAVCEILAGQFMPEQTFVVSGQKGQWHRERGEQRALALMRRLGTRGLQAWGSDVVMEEIFLALAHIIDFVEDDAVWDLAMVLMDKMLFTLAVNSYKGIFGCAKAHTSTAAVLGGYLDATSGISKLMWGMGIFTPDIRAAVSLACMEEYQFPVMLQEIAAHLTEAGTWTLERHAPEDEGVTLATYRSIGGMLASVQDYRPGDLGNYEHVWQATLGGGATVFVNHPLRADLDDAGGPNFWRGNGTLPRVAQWHDALIALYRLPEDDWMGFTHAYFPIHAFDEVAFREGRYPSPAQWAFARKGDGYLALWASSGLEVVEDGPSAQRELRAYGTEVAWLCQMGNAALDGEFAAFQERVLGQPVEVGALTDTGVAWTTLRGDRLHLNWSDPFMRNDDAVVFDAAHHIQSPYCVAEFPASMMDIRYGDIAMRLDFSPKDIEDSGDL